MAANSSTLDLLWALIAIALALAVVLAVVYGLRYAFNYTIQDAKLSISMLGLTVQRVTFSDIERVEVVPFSAMLPFSRAFRWDVFVSWKWCAYRRRVVAIRRRTGLVKGIVISPQDPEHFASLLTVASPEAVAQKGAKWPAPANGPK